MKISPRKIFLVIIGIVIILTVDVLYHAWFLTPEVGTVSVTIQSTSGGDVTRGLAQAGVVRNPWLFRLYFAFNRRTSRLKSGGYELAPNAPYIEILNQLTKGIPKTEVQVKIIEGWTVTDVEHTLVQDFGVAATSVQAQIGRSANRDAFDPAWRSEFSFLKALPSERSLEGYLFPDTYRVWKEQLPEGLVRKQLQTFQSQVASLPLTEKSLPLKSLDEVVRLASIVEKEVATDQDRRLVAGVFLTRLREGMPLQSDATVQYVTQSGRARSTFTDLQIRSDFNTYRKSGLPPAPIANPSLSAIEAVLNPNIQGYRYFLTDKAGKVYYGKTLAEHAQNRIKAQFDES
ncbi:endolytic transglycosylase MltG [Patescibacteria group bacterium]|nr:endolytic transglycosylase MltG [Patescibacteria group bacterium]